MFKGTSRTAPETIDRLTEDVGGFNNAFTTEDITNYYEVIPSNHLERLLWAEADRLASLVVNEENFVTERDVVIGEYDQRILAEPYGMLDELVNREATPCIRTGAASSAARPSSTPRRSTTSSRFTRRITVPTTRCSSSPAISTSTRRAAGSSGISVRIPTPPSPIPRVRVVEPPQTAERRLRYRAANVPLPARRRGVSHSRCRASRRRRARRARDAARRGPLVAAVHDAGLREAARDERVGGGGSARAAGVVRRARDVRARRRARRGARRARRGARPRARRAAAPRRARTRAHADRERAGALAADEQRRRARRSCARPPNAAIPSWSTATSRDTSP